MPALGRQGALLFCLRREDDSQGGICEQSLSQTAKPFAAQIDIFRFHVVLFGAFLRNPADARGERGVD
jgi:hypothetical protein